MMHRSFIAVILIVLAVTLGSAIYYLSRTQTRVPIAEDLVVGSVRLNRRTATLVGVNVTNIGIEPVNIVKVDLIKIQTAMIVGSDTLPSVVSVPPGSHLEIPLNIPLDPEGADYRIMITTATGSAATFDFGYP
jgi:hypothetical protein